MHLILLGAPGVGKGTQAKKIMKQYNIPQISTGDILRKEVSNRTDLGTTAKSIMDKGELVPDNLIFEMVKNRLSQSDCVNGFILDGFPRTIPQAEGLNILLKKLNINDLLVIDIYVTEEEIIRRLTSRRGCSNCGKDYNLNLNPPPSDNKCIICGGKMTLGNRSGSGPLFLSVLASLSVRAHNLTSVPLPASSRPRVIPQLVVPIMAVFGIF